MALSPSEQVLEALKSALDQVPLTAEQRQKTLSEFALRLGQPLAVPAVMHTDAPASGAMLLSPTAQAVMPSAAPAASPSSADPKLALQSALSHALEAAHSSAAPIPVESRTIVQEELISRLKNRMDEQGDGIDHSAVKALVRSSLVRERRRAGVSFAGGIVFAIIESVIVSASLAGVVLGFGGMKLLGEALFLTVADVFIVIVGLQLLGSLHEFVWLSTPHVYNLATLIRGACTPLSVPLGLLLYAHEWIWKDYSQNKLGRILRSIVSPVTVPIGLVWNGTGWVIGRLNLLAAPKKAIKNNDLALTEKEKSDQKQIKIAPVPTPA